MRIAARLVKGNCSWEEFDSYLQGVKSGDEAVHAIGWNLWIWTDPEYPSNRESLSSDVLRRIFVFLSSDRAYLPGPASEPIGTLSAIVAGLERQRRRGFAPGQDRFWPFRTESDYTAALRECDHEATECIRSLSPSGFSA